MAKQITQETFNNVVLENIKEFEMEPAEAFEDAIKQFEAQGVNLTMIIKDPKIFSEEGLNEEASTEKELLTSLNNLSEIFNSASSTSHIDKEQFLKECTSIREICGRGIAERCLATKVGANNILMEFINDTLSCCDLKNGVTDNAKLKDGGQMLNHLFKVYCCYIDSQPDLMNDEIMNVFLSLLKHVRGSPSQQELSDVTVEVAGHVLDIFSKFCYMHENNRQSLIQAGLARDAVGILDVAEKSNEEIVVCLVIKGCVLLKGLVADDDIRVAFGRAHEHCQIIVNQCDALPVLFALLKKFKGRDDASSSILSAISQLVVRDEFCVKVSEMGGVGVVMEMVKQVLHDRKKSPVLKSSLQLLKNLSGSDKVKVEVMSQPQGPGLICEAAERNMSDPAICEVACQLVASLMLRHPAHGKTLVEDNLIHDLLGRIMILHEKYPQVQKSCAMVIRNIVSRNPELRSYFLDAGVEELLRKALARHRETCRDEVSYALRDLNCEVQLRELWKGTGKQLAQ